MKRLDVLTTNRKIPPSSFFISCFTVSVIPSINTFESFNDFMILIIPFISSWCPDTSPTDISPTDTSPTDTSPTDISPTDISPTRHIPNGHFPDGHFPDRHFPESIILNINNVKIRESSSVVLLGLTIDNRLTFKDHINILLRRASFKLHALRRIRKCLTAVKTKLLYNAFINSQFNYASIIWMFCHK